MSVDGHVLNGEEEENQNPPSLFSGYDGAINWPGHDTNGDADEEDKVPQSTDITGESIASKESDDQSVMENDSLQGSLN
ncbi:MAG: hypothetical protein EZS28_024587 [Streblomastix strix]|uniref:Uncharacterized protein n=1 Tax=Streblomastix strix TaxID=222440 RepID=A0A5J4VBF5_9EUKA|nr:MAG: hypothetical protein EZS28_024587 [Streblomastix strix]